MRISKRDNRGDARRGFNLKTGGLTILLIAILIAILGVLSIYSSTYQKEGKMWQAIYKRQILWLLLGLAIVGAAAWAIAVLRQRRRSRLR